MTERRDRCRLSVVRGISGRAASGGGARIPLRSCNARASLTSASTSSPRLSRAISSRLREAPQSAVRVVFSGCSPSVSACFIRDDSTTRARFADPARVTARSANQVRTAARPRSGAPRRTPGPLRAHGRSGLGAPCGAARGARAAGQGGPGWRRKPRSGLHARRSGKRACAASIIGTAMSASPPVQRISWWGRNPCRFSSTHTGTPAG